MKIHPHLHAGFSRMLAQVEALIVNGKYITYSYLRLDRPFPTGYNQEIGKVPAWKLRRVKTVERGVRTN